MSVSSLISLVVVGVLLGSDSCTRRPQTGGLSPAALEQLLGAIEEVESGGNPWAVGDRHLKCPAYGLLQIRQPVCDDLNRHFGTRYRARDCLGNRTLSRQIGRAYLSMWVTSKRLGRPPTIEDAARIWNGGPSGWRRAGTLAYWQRVKTVLTKSGTESSKCPGC